MTIDDEIYILTNRLMQLEDVLEMLCKPVDSLYKRDVQLTYDQVLRDRTLLIKRRG